MVKIAGALLVVSVSAVAVAAGPVERSLSHEDRIRFQQAIESVDGRRRTDLARLDALQSYWKIVPTEALLDRELSRLAREITPPELLARLRAALEDDPFLIRECLARPAFIERVGRDLYAFDPAIHAAARADAVELRRKLVSGELDPLDEYPGRSVIEVARGSNEDVGSVSAVSEEREGFELSVVLSATSRDVRLARYVIDKTTFEDWWGMGRVTSAEGPETYSFCGVNGQTIGLRLDEGTTRPSDAAPSQAIVLDAAGEPIPRGGSTWTAPYTGVYFAQVTRDPAAIPGDFRLVIGTPDATALDQLADLDVTATGAPNPVDAGGLLSHTVVLRNLGPGSALDAEMLFLLPEFTTYAGITVPPNGEDPWKCVAPIVGGKGKISCTAKCVAPGATATFTVESKVDACLGGVNLSGKANVSSATPDLNPSNNAQIATTGVTDPGTCDDGNFCTAGDQCGPGVGVQQNFDDLPVPFLPADWTTTLVIGPVGVPGWRSTGAFFHTAPNSAFAADAPEIRDAVLDSPAINIATGSAQVRFRNRFDLEKDNDGGVLEIQIGGGPFVDILDAGGSFVSGAYNGTIRTGFASPIAGRRAWTGLQTAFVLTTVNLPATAAGRSIVLRWRLATDLSLGNVGQWIDTVSVSGRSVCYSGTQSACDDSDPCTSDACDPSEGCSHVTFSCDDENPCTDDVCDGVGQCSHTNNTAPCDDRDACTLVDECAAGACVGMTAVTCHDADVCTADSCDSTLRCVSTTADFDGTGFSVGRVDGRDLSVLADAWNSCPGSPRYDPAANLDRQNACIGMPDFHLFMNAFGRDCPP